MKSAGMVGRSGPQSKQPFLVAFFKASEVLLRTIRAAGAKKKNSNRSKSAGQQETSRAPSTGGGPLVSLSAYDGFFYSPSTLASFDDLLPKTTTFFIVKSFSVWICMSMKMNVCLQ